MKQELDMKKLQSSVIDWLRFPLAIAVIFIHSFGVCPLDLDALHSNPFTGMSIYNWIRICFSHVFTHIAVPTFYVISGYLFFCNWGGQWSRQLYNKKLKSRFHTLIIPYFCWNLIAILVIVVSKIAAFIFKGKPLSNILTYFQENGWLRMFWDNNIWGGDYLNWLGLSMSSSGPIDLPLWFLRDLIVVIILVPVIFFYLKHTKFYGLILLAASYVTQIWPDIHGLSITAVFFSSVGAYLGINGKNMIVEFRRFRNLSYISAFIFLIITVWFDGRNTELGSLFHPLYIISGVCAIFNLAAQLLKKNKVKVHSFLSQSTFFIYAVHTLLVLRLCSFIVRNIIGGSSAFALIISYLTIPVLTVGVCLLLFFLMKKLTPRLLGILTGNRF